ncbi:hypothetical protein HDU77_001077 [Chytriomyces hyalinus]|nr:hypothetical protein HDU77_001077 [Chytriomyces hyalinus]
MSYASEVPLRVAIKESQRNSDIFSNASTPSAGTPRSHARFDRNASTVFGGAWADQQQSPSNGRVDRMASDIFNTNHQSPSPGNKSGSQKNYQPSFLDSHQSKRRVTPPEEDSYPAYHQSLDDSHLDDEYSHYQSMQNEQLKQASPVQRRQGTPFSHNSYDRDESSPIMQEYESSRKSAAHHYQSQKQESPFSQHAQNGRDYQTATPTKSSSFQNIFADNVPVSAMKRTDHHKHTSIFNDFGTSDSPKSNAAAASASMNPKHCAAPAADYYASMPPTVPTQASTNRANSVSSNSVFPNSFGETLQQFTDVPRSGRRHFQVPSRSSIFDDSNEPGGMNLGSASSRRRGGAANDDVARNDGPGAFPGSNANRDYYPLSNRSSSVSFASDDGRSGGLSSSDLNRERFGRGRRQAFETSQIFF